MGPAVVSTAESIVAAQAVTPVPAASEQVAAEPAADSDSDSTDSDSDSTDSDSDSDSEDEQAQMKKEIKSFAPEAEPQRVTVTEVKAGTNEAQNEYGAPITPGVETPAPLGAAQATVKVPSVGSEKLVKSGPEIIAASENTREVTGSDVSAKTAAGVIKDAAFPVDAQVEAPGEAVGEAVTLKDPRSSSAEAAAVAGGEAGAEDALPAVAEASVCAGSTEEQMDLAPIVTETAGEELQTEEAAAAPLEPEEPFDNSTYKNYQHHSYNPYTFADLDLQMAKFRLPQPSSGKPSPRH
ncbi:unnamed protein product [Oreochromis niloticus]|nr:unnamed protein product [Mustela putorius furo]